MRRCITGISEIRREKSVNDWGEYIGRKLVKYDQFKKIYWTPFI